MANHIFSGFDAQELIQIAQSLIKIPSENPIGNEEEVAFYIRNILEENGISAALSYAAPQRPNVVATLQGINPGPIMIFNGHLDVVPSGTNWTKAPFEGIIEGEKLYGRGAADMKSGVAAMLYAAIMLKRMGSPFDGKLILLFNVDEEYSNIGIKHFMKDPITADYVIVGEPTNMNVCICHKGDGRYRLHTYGVAGHTAVVEEADNAIYKMAKLIVALDNLSLKIKQRTHEMLGSASLTVAQINGGTAPNIVPSHAYIEIDRRVIPGEEEDEIFNEIERTVSEIAKKDGFEFLLDPYLFIAPHSIPENHVLTQTALRISKEISQEDKHLKRFLATTEASFFSVNKGIPTIIMGPGSIQQAHKEDEWVDIREIIDASLVYMKMALEMLKS